MTKASKASLLTILRAAVTLLGIALLFLVLVDVVLILVFLVAGDGAVNAYLEWKNFPLDALMLHTTGFAVMLRDQPLDTVRTPMLLYSLGMETGYTLIRLVALFYIRRILDDSVRQGPFIMKNVNRIRIMGTVIGLAPQALNVLAWQAGGVFAPHVAPGKGEAFAFFWFDTNALFLGVILWVLAEAFRQGVRIREDQDLTI